MMLSEQRKTQDLKKNFNVKSDNPVSMSRWKDHAVDAVDVVDVVDAVDAVVEPVEQNKQSQLTFPWGLLQINQIMLLKYF